MSESGYTQLPPGSLSGLKNRLPAKDGQMAQIERLPGPLQILNKPVRVTAEIVNVNRQTGEVRLRTDDDQVIELRVRPRAQAERLPAQGARVEIDLPAGRPPRQALIRRVPENATPPPSQPPTDQSGTAREQAASLPPARAETPDTPARAPSAAAAQAADIDAQERARQAAQAFLREIAASLPAPSKPGSLQNGDHVRLLPLPPGTESQIIQAPRAQIIAAMLGQIAAASGTVFKAAAPAAPAADQSAALKSAGLLQAGKSDIAPLSPSLGQATPLIQASSPDRILTAAAAPLNTMPALPLSITPPDSTTPAAAPAIRPAGMNAMQFHSLPALPPGALFDSGAQGTTLRLIPHSAQAAASSHTKPQAIDVSILNIKPPDLLLRPALLSPENSALPGQQSAAPASNEPPLFTATALPQTGAEALTNSQASPARIDAQIVGETSRQQPVLRLLSPGNSFPDLFVMQAMIDNLPIGSHLTISAGTLMPAPASGHSMASLGGTSGSGTAAISASLPFWDISPGAPWPAGHELISTLQQLAPGLLQNLAQVTPNPAQPQQLPAAALLFIAAARAGDLGSWLNDRTMDVLRRHGRSDTIDRLGRAMGAGNARPATDASGQDWRAMSLPLFWQDELQQMMLYYRHDHDEQNAYGNDKEGATRFIFDFALPRMGAVQLDGLHRPAPDHAERKTRLDIVLRTLSMPSTSMQQTMRRHYMHALSASGLDGELSFQGRSDQFIQIDVRQEKTSMSV